MTKKRRRRPAGKPANDVPGFVWMLFGLAIGLAVAMAVWLHDGSGERRAAGPVPQAVAREDRPATPPALDDNGETAGSGSDAAGEPASRFDFYTILPSFEVVVPEQEAQAAGSAVPQTVVEPGTYVLQAGSFSRYEDADRRRAELALQGIESTIQRVTIDERTYHRVRIGPISDLERLNVLRSRLRQASIDVLRIRLEDR